MKAFFTGHRNIYHRITQYKLGITELIEIALAEGVTHFYCGMAVGADQLVARTLVDWGLKWIAVIPCADQSKLWNTKVRKEYQNLLRFAQRKIVLYPNYSPGVMQARNVWMVKNSSLCLGLYDGRQFGGTKLTFDLAIANKLTVASFNPITLETKIIQTYKQLSLF